MTKEAPRRLSQSGLFGDRNYGTEAAAQHYWGIPAADLNIQ